MNVRVVSIVRWVNSWSFPKALSYSFRQTGCIHINGRQSIWNYVHTGLENADSYTIIDGLKEGDIVITSGNINLAHEAPVKVIDN